MKNNIRPIGHLKLYRSLGIMQNSPTVREGLIAIAAEADIPYKESLSLADEVMRKLQDKYSAPPVRKETVRAVNTFCQEALQDKSAKTRVEILDKMDFCLNLPEYSSLLKEMESGKENINSLYEKYRGCKEPDPSLQNEMSLRNHLQVLVERLNLSPRVLSILPELLAEDDCYISNAADIGLEVFQFKCAATLLLYLENRETIDMDEAAKVASTQMYLPLYPRLQAEQAAMFLIAALHIAFMVALTGMLWRFCSLMWAEVFAITIGFWIYEEINRYRGRIGETSLCFLLRMKDFMS